MIDLLAVSDVRPAAPEDALAVSALYEDAYRPHDGGSARDHYPFAQFLDCGWLAQAYVDPRYCWVVAEQQGRIVGSAGALRNVGSDEDQVAEIFGIVVDGEIRKKGVGSGLLARLCEILSATAKFIICESRTALAGGWKISRANKFVPFGFEPFAHATPAGAESMLLTGRVAAAALEEAGWTPHQQQNLFASALRLLRTMPTRREVGGRGVSSALTIDEVAVHSRFRLSTCEEAQPFLARHRALKPHGAGVVELARLEGEDGQRQRYEQRFYLAHGTDGACAATRVVLDSVDRRARILEFASDSESLRYPFLDFIVTDLDAHRLDHVFSIAVDVVAADEGLKHALLRLGFTATTIYPALISIEGTRANAIQFTRLFRQNADVSLRETRSVEWIEARMVIASVVDQFAKNH